MSERTADLLLATVLAALPLLPTGAQYIGLSTSSWTEGALLLLIALRFITPRAQPGTAPASAAVMSSASALWVVMPFVVAVTGGAIVGLASNNVMASSAFLANLREAPLQLFAPMNQGANPLYPLRVWLTLVEGPAAFLLVAAICRRASDPRRRARAALAGAVIGLALVSGFAVFQYVARFHLHPHWAQADPSLVRSHSTFEDPNTLGSYLVLGIGLALAWWQRERMAGSRGARRWMSAGVLVLASAALVTSVSRAALAAAVLAALLLSRRRAARLAVAAIGILFVAWLAARIWLPAHADYHPTGPVEAVLETVDPRVPLAQVLKGRQLFWAAALEMARMHPFTGIGVGRYPRVLSQKQGFEMRVENAHNFFLQLLAETGGAGLLAFLLMVAIPATALRTAAQAGGEHAGMAWGLSFGFVAFALTLCAGDPLLLPSVQLVVGTTLAAGLMAAFTPAHEAGRRQIPRGALPAAVAVLVIAYGIAIGRSSWDDPADLFGYSSGLYALERDQSRWAFRWTGREARLYMRVPAGATTLRLDFSVFPPAGGTPTTVTIDAAGRRLTVVCEDAAWRQVNIPLDAIVATRRAVEIRIMVDRVAVPASLGVSQDARELGAMIRPPSFAVGTGPPIR